MAVWYLGTGNSEVRGGIAFLAVLGVPTILLAAQYLLHRMRLASAQDAARWIPVLPDQPASGGAVPAVHWLHARVRDPDSLIIEGWRELLHSSTWWGSLRHYVEVQWRSRNGHGGYERQASLFVLDEDGNVLCGPAEREEPTSTTVVIWNVEAG
jgi:hypothetical protein